MKKFIPIAAAGGALYYYDQNVNPIISRNFQVAEKSTPVFQKSDIEKAKKDVKQQSQSFSSQVQKDVEKKYNQLESKTTDLSSQASAKLAETRDELQSRWNKFDISAPPPKKETNPVRSGVGSYLDFVNGLGNKIWGKNKEVERKLEKQSDDYKYGWFSFGTGHKEQLEKKYDIEKARATKKYELAKQKLDDYKESVKDATKQPANEQYFKQVQADFDSSLNSLKSYGNDTIDQVNKDIENSKNAWFSWGRKKQDKLQDEYNKSKAEASSQYDSAKKYVDDLSAQIQKSNPFKTKKEQDEHLQAAQDHLSKSFDNLKKYGNDLIDTYTK